MEGEAGDLSQTGEVTMGGSVVGRPGGVGAVFLCQLGLGGPSGMALVVIGLILFLHL